MSYYGGENWQAPGRTPSWEQQQQQQQGQQQGQQGQQQGQQQQQQQQPPARSGTTPAGSRDEPNAFASQIAEVDKAIDNLMKSGKFPMGMPGGPRGANMPGPGRPFVDFDPRMGGGPRPHPPGEFDSMRPHGNAGLQSFYQNQRYGGPNSFNAPNNGQRSASGGMGGPVPTNSSNNNEGGPQDARQNQRRNAAQRERELRNYHQEQQYQKHLSGAKASNTTNTNNNNNSNTNPNADASRSLSPNAGMTEEERRELIARQYRGLYGEGSTLYNEGGQNVSSRAVSGDARVTSGSSPGLRGASPMTFGMNVPNKSANSNVQMPARDNEQNASNAGEHRGNSSSPSGNATPSFGGFSTQQSGRASASSPNNTSPPRSGPIQSATAPIGTRPGQSAQPSSTVGIQKRSTTPLPSPLSFGFSANGQSNPQTGERSTSASSNPNSAQDKGAGLGWNNNGGVWGNPKGGLGGVQASVWS